MLLPEYFGVPWPGDPRVNIQDDKGKAKPYQVQQVLKAIVRLKAERGRKTATTEITKERSERRKRK